MKTYQTMKRMKAAEARENSLIDIDMTDGAFTAYDCSALVLHALYPQLPFRHVTCEDGETHPMVTDIPQEIVLEVCRRYRLVDAAARLINGD
ncbi:hypothetical protein JN06_02509 [Bacteroides zoogleoformans]|nr:hypothetical protein JN06_02509 [Bacteroides zoogleoformans]